ncbi:hypothetical protein Emag_004322 [Eimeria magna]
MVVVEIWRFGLRCRSGGRGGNFRDAGSCEAAEPVPSTVGFGVDVAEPIIRQVTILKTL